MDFTYLKEKQARELRSTRIKIIVMLALLAVGIGAVIKYPARNLFTSEDKPVSTKITTALRITPEPLTPAIEPPPTAPPEVQAPDISHDPAWKLIQDRHTDLEPGPFFHLLRILAKDKYEDLRAHAKKDVDWNVFWDKPETVRAEPVEIRGTLIRSFHQSLGKNSLNLHEVWVYRLKAENAPRESQGYLYDVYSIEKLYGAIQDDHIVAYGRFFKARTLEASTFKEADLNAALILAPRLEPLTYVDAAEPPGPIVQGGPVELRALYWFLKHITTIDLADIKKKAVSNDPADLKKKDVPTFTHVDLIGRPEDFLGKPIAVRGQLIQCERIPLEENPLHLESVYRGFIVDADHGMYTFYCRAIPPGLHLKDEVRLYGIFLKKWTYANSNVQSQETQSAVCIGSALVRINVARDSTLDVILAGMIGVIAIVFVVAHFRTRRQAVADAEARRQRDLAHVPPNLNEVARRVLAEAHGAGPARGKDALPTAPADQPGAAPPQPGPATAKAQEIYIDADPASPADEIPTQLKCPQCGAVVRGTTPREAFFICRPCGISVRVSGHKITRVTPYTEG